ncbi:DUF3316 domain-containing protein [Parabacteroides pacaensis]|uniref:DUF3316 domain-containing protein n=1 Tax=Parabacteroides pacaensis TaxID=2086575 RepID=UPI000D112781|nr:DUF3316 domain-containing protein [Parabacteroides pacaensis]
MKRIGLSVCIFLSCYCFAWAQSEEGNSWSTNEATLIGIGGYNVKDTYLSPYQYMGWGLRVLNERMKMVKLGDHHFSRQQVLNIDISFTDNPAETASDFSGFIDYTLAYHYRLFPPVENLKVLVGPAARADLGFIYNTRNGNNPAAAKAGIDFNLSAMAIYTWYIKNYPLTIRYQLETPFMGAMFAPHYGQSYYEIFDLGNYKGVVSFVSFHNQLAFRNYVTVDFSIGNFTIRAGFLNTSYRTHIHEIKSRILSNSFMIGFVKEFVSFSGKRLKNQHQYASAYY